MHTPLRGLALLIVTLLLGALAPPVLAADADDVAQLNVKIDQLETLTEDLAQAIHAADKNLDAQGDSLTPRVDSAEGVARDVSFEVKKLMDAWRGLHGRVSDLADEVGQFRPTVLGFKAQIADFSRRLERAEGDTSVLSVRVSDLGDALDEIELGLGTLERAQLGALDLLRAEVEAFIHGLRAEVEAFIYGTGEALQALSSDFLHLRSRFAQQDEQVDLNRRRIESLKQQSQALMDQSYILLKLNARLESAFETQSRFEGHIRALEARLAGYGVLNGGAAELEGSVADLSLRYQEFEARLDAIELEAPPSPDEARAQLRALRARLDEAEAMVTALKASRSIDTGVREPGPLDDLRAQIKALRDKITSLLIEVERNDKLVAELSAQLEARDTGSTLNRSELITRITAEFRMEIQSLLQTIQDARDAAKQAQIANGLALLALLTGVAGILMALILR